MKILLDTHTVLWWDNDQLPAAVTKRIQRADRVYISAVSAWEITIKSELGKLEAKGSVSDLIADYGFSELPVTVVHAERLRSLPPLHRDPFDRLLIAQALSEDLVFVTADRLIAKYSVPVAWG